MIEAPDREYIYHATTIDRINVMRREAMQGNIVEDYSTLR